MPARSINSRRMGMELLPHREMSTIRVCNTVTAETAAMEPR
jgi:hypothetical protein